MPPLTLAAETMSPGAGGLSVETTCYEVSGARTTPAVENSANTLMRVCNVDFSTPTPTIGVPTAILDNSADIAKHSRARVRDLAGREGATLYLLRFAHCGISRRGPDRPLTISYRTQPAQL